VLLEKCGGGFYDTNLLGDAAAIHWFKETPSSFARRWAAFLTECGSFKEYVALLMVSSSSRNPPALAQVR
jgi:hypothetical protein